VLESGVPFSDPERKRGYDRQWVAARRAAWFSDKCCVRCNSVEKLRLDHVDAKTKVRSGDHAIWSWSFERREAELAKCQVLCEPCHIIKTAENKEHPRGERDGASKLTAVAVDDIRHSTQSLRVLAAKWGVSPRLIGMVRRNEIWRHV
jgi:hypothetical protein